MPRRGKKYNKTIEKVDRQKRYGLDEALELLPAPPSARCDEAVALPIRLGVNPRHADQMVRGAVVLPHGTGRTIRVLVFAKGEKEKEAMDAGADHGGSEDLIEG